MMSDPIIYFILDENQSLIKIGKTTISNVKSRLSALQTGCPNKLRVIGVIRGSTSEESKVHSMFEEFHHRGEWFKMHPDILQFIKDSDDFDLLEHIPTSIYKISNLC